MTYEREDNLGTRDAWNSLPRSPLSHRAEHNCIEEGCDRAQVVKGRCKKHYNDRFRKTSDGVCTGTLPKLTADDVREVKRMNAALATRKAIATRFGVSLPTIAKVLNGTYKPRS